MLAILPLHALLFFLSALSPAIATQTTRLRFIVLYWNGKEADWLEAAVPTPQINVVTKFMPSWSDHKYYAVYEPYERVLRVANNRRLKAGQASQATKMLQDMQAVVKSHIDVLRPHPGGDSDSGSGSDSDGERGRPISPGRPPARLQPPPRVPPPTRGRTPPSSGSDSGSDGDSPLTPGSPDWGDGSPPSSPPNQPCDCDRPNQPPYCRCGCGRNPRPRCGSRTHPIVCRPMDLEDVDSEDVDSEDVGSKKC